MVTLGMMKRKDSSMLCLRFRVLSAFPSVSMVMLPWQHRNTTSNVKRLSFSDILTYYGVVTSKVKLDNVL